MSEKRTLRTRNKRKMGIKGEKRKGKGKGTDKWHGKQVKEGDRKKGVGGIKCE